MWKSCKAAQSAYLDNGGIAAHESPAGPASCTIGPATRSRSSSVERGFCGLLNGLFAVGCYYFGNVLDVLFGENPIVQQG